jgi:putative membrane protein
MNVKKPVLTALKGMAMGAADVVPGVSGGTIAFITGIYDELLGSINAINLDAFKTLKENGIKGLWSHVNGSFLLPLFIGIAISFISLAKVIEYLLKNHPVLLWAFFFGLVVASVIYVGKQVKQWHIKNISGLVVGTGIAFYITILPPLGGSNEAWFMFVSGAIAICAMILPGISGSFILLILGAYRPVIQAINDRNFVTIATVSAGCIIGLLSFSRVLKWLFEKHENLTIATLTGFLVGSLNKIWPWKEVLEYYIKHEGEPNEEKVALVEKSIAPFGDNILMATALAIFGFAIVFIMDKFAPNTEEN